MAGIILPHGADPRSYRGLPTLYEFVNSDGGLTRFNCGQAAACTLLAHSGAAAVADSESAAALMADVETAHPPDNLGGWLGTSRRGVERICRQHGVELDEVRGVDELRAALAAERPVAVLVKLPGPKILGIQFPVGHWMVAYGYDDRQVFLSNFESPGMPWDEFRRAWTWFFGRLVSMWNTGLVARST